MRLELECGAKLPRHALLAGSPTWRRETITWLTAEAAPAEGEAPPLIERRQRRLWQVVPLPPAEGPTLPGWLPDPEPLEEAAPLVELARFQGRAAVLAEGVTWIEGRLSAGGQGERAARLILEGAPGDILPLAARLAEELPLLPARVSLAEAALALAEGRAPRPRRQGPPALGEVAGVEEALRGALGHLLEVLLAETAACTLAAGPRGVHQSRVALRRTRSLLRIFRPLVDGPDWRAWDGLLRELAALLGPARDWDVFLSGIGQGTLEALGGDVRVRRLLGAARRERDAAYAALGEALAGPGFRRTIWLGLALLVLRPESPPVMPLAPFAAEVLRKRWRRLKRAGAAMEALDETALHEMRLDAKRLRYAAEPFAPLWPGKPARRFTRRLAALQEALGLANDAVVARALAARLEGRGAGGFAIGTVTGFAAGRAEGSRLASIGAWEALRRAGPFWKLPEPAEP